MKVFKFGGASVKDAESVKNVAIILKEYNSISYLLVVSAMGKTTNALEKVLHLYINSKDYLEQIESVKNFHLEIAHSLFESENPIFEEVETIFKNLDIFLKQNKSTNYNFIYDQVVITGEIISSKILSTYLNSQEIFNNWLDARHYIKTDNNYREGKVNWELTEQNISSINEDKNYVTQGFIASDENNFNTTLGREGSDYTAGIFAYCLNAESMTIWKDVAGVMTGDPRKFENVELLEYLSYKEAIEMAYYGASVIHPKTLQPLQRKNIPFFVKSFLSPNERGTEIGTEKDDIKKKETYILKENQILLNISTKDFSFITENHLGMIFSLLADCKIKVSLMQNSAISLALCLEDKYNNINILSTKLSDRFEIEKIDNVSLLSVRNIELKNIEKPFVKQEVLLKQINQQTLQIVIKTN